jgi:glycosyltransferase involved in cell wall biosynthesis
VPQQHSVSIIMPAYNHGRFIERALNSVVRQTYPHWDLIVIDDGSTDDTAEAVSRVTDPRVHYLHQANQGVRRLASTINRGLQATAGDLVTMMASDDTWPEDRLIRQLPVFSDPRVILVYGRGQIIDENDQVLGVTGAPPPGTNLENVPIGSALNTMLVANYIFQPSVLIRRSALERIGGYLQPPELLAEDYPTHMALALIGEFRYLDAVLANYRMHGAQMTRNHYEEMVETDIPFALEFFRSLTPEQQQRSGWTETTLSKRLQRRLRDSYFEVGRRYLLACKWSDARTQFVRALLHGTARARAKAMLGIGCSFLHVDLERVARRVRGVSLR